MQMYFWLILPDNGTAMLEQCLVSILCKRMKMFPLFYVAIWTLEWGVRFRLILTLHCRILKRLDVIFDWTKAQQHIWAPNAAQEILKKMNTSPVYWCCVQVLIYMFWTEHVMVTRVVCTITYPLLVIVFWLFYIFSLSLFFAWGKMQVLERIDFKRMTVICSMRCQTQPNYCKEVDATECKLKLSDDKFGLFEQN